MRLLTEKDLARLQERGIPREEAERQLALLASPPPPPELVRPCTAGDGIARLEPERHDELAARYDEARAAGRAMKLVPASGAASRMFKTLLPWTGYAGQPERLAEEVSRRAVAGEADAGDPVRFLSELPRFAFYDELAAALAAEGQDLEALRRQGEAGGVLHALLAPDRLGYDARPKALIPFHRYGGPGAPSELGLRPGGPDGLRGAARGGGGVPGGCAGRGAPPLHRAARGPGADRGAPGGGPGALRGGAGGALRGRLLGPVAGHGHPGARPRDRRAVPDEGREPAAPPRRPRRPPREPGFRSRGRAATWCSSRTSTTSSRTG
jgi:hypothetical protein